MADALASVRKPFLDRIRAPKAWALVGYRLSRPLFAFGLALLPFVLVLLAVAAGPAELAKAVTSQKNVQEAFARFVTAVATASAIAVSVATLTLSREMKGVRSLQEREEANHGFRERVRSASGRGHVPLPLGDFLRSLLEAAAADARLARRNAPSTALALREDEVALGDLLDAIERRAVECAAALDARRASPDALLVAALDFETDVSTHYVERFARSAPEGPLREALEGLADRLCDFAVGSRYAKTMDTQWGLSNMSWAVLLSTIPSVLTATGMVLAYGDGAVDALGRVGAGALVGLALSAVVLPLSFFVSYVLRFVFINEHTLPTDGFVLGPEAFDVVRSSRRGARART